MHPLPTQHRRRRRAPWLRAVDRRLRGQTRLRPGPPLSRQLLATVVSVVAALATIVLALDAHDLRHGVRVAGTVVDRSEREDDPSVTVSFAVDGVDHECTTFAVRGHPQVGAGVRLRYVPSDPEASCAVGEAGRSYAPAGLAGGGAALSTGWSVTVRRRRRRARRADGNHDGWCDTW